MSLLNEIETGFIRQPFYGMAHGPKGVGKTTIGSTFPRPLFFDMEESSKSFDVQRVEPTSYEEVMSTLKDAISREKGTLPFESLIIDSGDMLERIIHKKVCADHDVLGIEDISFKNGYIYALDYWFQIIKETKKLRDAHGVHVLWLCHSIIKKFDNPQLNASYDRYIVKMHHKAADLLEELCEMVLFVNSDVSTKKDKLTKKTHAIDMESHCMFTRLSAAFDAKNRIGLPKKIQFTEHNAFEILWGHYMQASGETAQDVYEQCLEAIKRVPNEEDREQMRAFVDSKKNSKATLRSALDKILEKSKEGE